MVPGKSHRDRRRYNYSAALRTDGALFPAAGKAAEYPGKCNAPVATGLAASLPDPVPFVEWIRRSTAEKQAASPRYIAHCLAAPRAADTLAALVREQASDPAEATLSLILIGPEGDFSPREVAMALAAGYQPVSLGANRLRTETAGMVAAALLCIK